MEKLREQYEKEVIPALMKKFEYKSVMQVPKLEKIVINIGLGDTKDNPKALDNAINDLSIITGQKPVITKAKKSIAAFKLREGAKADILAGMEEANKANNEISTARENGDFTGVPTDLCEDNLDTLVYYYAHICDDVDDFGYVVSSLNNEFNGKTK